MNASAPIAPAAASMSGRLAPGRPKLMFSATVPENRKFSCMTITTTRRSWASLSSSRPTPSIVTRPSSGSYRRASSRAIVVLPTPVRPTSATVWPAGITRSSWGSTSGSPR